MMILDHNLELEKSKQAGSIIIFKMIQTPDRAGRRRKRQFNWGMISKVVEKVIPQV